MKLPSVYDPHEYEEQIYALWEKKGMFQPQVAASDDYYSLVFPPPNANGNLHMGHALTVAIEDALARYHRLQGKATLFVPGADHAGFETQVVYEKKLSQEGKSRFDYSREELYKLIWDFVQLNKQSFEAQIRALGASVDWTRFTFTLDDKVVATAYDTFKMMWDDGLIYRGKRFVNFCTFHGTGFSDIEVVDEDEVTKLWHIRYPLADGAGEIVVATTRPETMLGDTAVAVNPKDERYKNLVGKKVKLPQVGREIPIVADEAVDPEFGSGAVKVTPAHDPVDFEIAERQKLEAIDIVTPEGKISGEAPAEYRGLDTLEAREKLIAALESEGFVKDAVDYTHTVGKCYKCGTKIEPLRREQWFVKMRPLADEAARAIKDGKITFYPPSKLEQTVRYLEKIKDWNISRQIAWGIPIPAFQNTQDSSDWIFDTRVQQETIEVGGKTYRRDPDVFDTWFSSGQWPYATLNFPDGEEFKRFYPLSLMETGGEILYQWVVRMIMLGLYRTGEVPFRNVYIHGYVMAEDGQKMSKSLGNVIDPLELVKEYGSDALRMGLLTGRRAGVNQGFHPAKVKAGRNFSNKLWNIARFIEDKVGENHQLKVSPEPKNRADHWILSRLNQTSEEIAKAFESYRLSEAYELLYKFIWNDFADWYIEASKNQPNLGMLAYLLESSLKMSHPFAPFLTETIWQTLAWEEGTMLAVQQWPKVGTFNSLAAAEFRSLTILITEARQAATALGVKRPNLLWRAAPIIGEEAENVARLGGLGEISETSEGAGAGLKLVQSGYDAWLDIDQQTAKAYLAKLEEKQAGHARAVTLLEKRLASPDYTSKAPKQLVEQTRQQLAKEKELQQMVADELKKFQQSMGA